MRATGTSPFDGKMPFGRFEGFPLQNVPSKYFQSLNLRKYPSLEAYRKRRFNSGGDHQQL